MSQPTSISFRALCAELVNELHDYKVANEQHDDALVNRARAALAQPEPKGPTDEELISPIMWMIDECVYDKGEIAQILRELIARFGRLAIEPVPVAERLPGVKDCDAEGRCWLHGPHLFGDVAAWVYGCPAWA
jgi:hypothetical protein